LGHYQTTKTIPSTEHVFTLRNHCMKYSDILQSPYSNLRSLRLPVQQHIVEWHVIQLQVHNCTAERSLPSRIAIPSGLHGVWNRNFCDTSDHFHDSCLAIFATQVAVSTVTYRNACDTWSPPGTEMRDFDPLCDSFCDTLRYNDT
jgi:hypothetical protein